MKKKWSVLPALPGTLLLFVSCYPGEVTSVAQLDVVVTTHDDTVSFTSFATYALLDSVVHIDLDDNMADSLLDRSNDVLILSEVRAGIEAMGYVLEPNPDVTQPDVTLLVGAIATENDVFFAWGWWPWWGWGGGWGGCCYGPGWGWGWPPTGGVGSVTYEVGTLMIAMVDPDRPSNPDGPIDLAPVMWLAALNGVLTGSSISQQSRITTLIRQAYSQSPYLKTN